MTVAPPLPAGFLQAPGVFDGVSALLGDGSPFPALYVTGYGVSASRFGLPDAGLIGLAEMLDAIRIIRRCSAKPLIADADTGYGGLLNVQHTVRCYEAAGVTAIQLEDQENPKKCGHTGGKRVVDRPEAIARIEVAVESRTASTTRIVARTDSLATHGFDEAMARAYAFRAAGADLVMIDALENEAQMRAVGAAFPAAALVNLTPSGAFFKTPQATPQALADMGFAIAIYPALMATPAWEVMDASIRELADTGNQPVPRVGARSPHELVGFGRVWADEARWRERYGGGL